MKTWRFVHIDDSDCAAEFGVNYPGIALFRSYEKESFSLGAISTLDELSLELRRHRIPAVINFNEEFIKPVMDEMRVCVVLLTPNSSKDKHLDYYKEFEKVAQAEF